MRSNEEDEVERQRQLDQQQHERLNEAGTLDGLKEPRGGDVSSENFEDSPIFP